MLHRSASGSKIKPPPMWDMRSLTQKNDQHAWIGVDGISPNPIGIGNDVDVSILPQDHSNVVSAVSIQVDDSARVFAPVGGNEISRLSGLGVS